MPTFQRIRDTRRDVRVDLRQNDYGHQSAYLSVDLDYWAYNLDLFGGPERADRLALRFIKKMVNTVSWLVLVGEHDLALPHINGRAFDTLINIDMHSDLPDVGPHSTPISVSGDTKSCVSEGTWGAFVIYPHAKTFVWRNPPGASYREGACSSDTYNRHDPFCCDEASVFRRTKVCSGTAGLPWNRINAGCIAISMRWWGVGGKGTLPASAYLPKTLAFLRSRFDLTQKQLASFTLYRQVKGLTLVNRSYQQAMDLALRPHDLIAEKPDGTQIPRVCT